MMFIRYLMNFYDLQIFSRQILPLVELRTWTTVFQQIVQMILGEWHRGNAVVLLAQYHPIDIYILSITNNEEPTFVRARSISRLVQLNSVNEYYVIPVYFEANSFGKFELDVLCDVLFTKETSSGLLNLFSNALCISVNVKEDLHGSTCGMQIKGTHVDPICDIYNPDLI
ncbi:unnamed protein product [Rotaria sordida]|uniref:Uncharacterized protein n=1 Tax=Rotaria sordida TaxID=392033 RepID=A0A814X431_9BILA|nr:unnamed protein product [Rotaria sordida]